MMSKPKSLSSGDVVHGRAEAPSRPRLFALDGVRALSILVVLAAHMLPIGPKRWGLNEASGLLGMSLFFSLSGFLIATQLHAKRSVAAFFVRRMFRIVPLAWLAAVVFVLALSRHSANVLPAHLLFYANTDFDKLTPTTAHFWSLCVEVHFYLFIGALMALTRFRGFAALPYIWAALLTVRAIARPVGSIETQFRIDEIFAGAVLALVYLDRAHSRIAVFVSGVPLLAWAALLCLSSHPATSHLNALRGVFASGLVGHLLVRTERGELNWLGHRGLRYVAEVSYALYVVHPATMVGWLGSGEHLVKYAKRPLSIALTFGLAHLSTFHFERHFQALGHAIAKKLESGRARGATKSQWPLPHPVSHSVPPPGSSPA